MVVPRGAPHAGNLAVEAPGLEIVDLDEILIGNWLSQGRAADCQNLTTEAPALERIDLREMREISRKWGVGGRKIAESGGDTPKCAHGVIVRSVNELPSRDTRRTKCKTEPVVQPKTARRGSKEIETALRNRSLSQAGCNRLA